MIRRIANMSSEKCEILRIYVGNAKIRGFGFYLRTRQDNCFGATRIKRCCDTIEDIVAIALGPGIWSSGSGSLKYGLPRIRVTLLVPDWIHMCPSVPSTCPGFSQRQIVLPFGVFQPHKTIA